MKLRHFCVLAACAVGPSTVSPVQAVTTVAIDRCATGKYVINASCWRDPDSSECASETVVDVNVALQQVHAQMDRPSPGLKRNGHDGFRKFHGAFEEEGAVDGRKLRGGYTATYPREGACDPGAYRQPFPMTGQFVMRGGERYLELAYPYRSFDTGSCALAGSSSERSERWYRVAPRGIARLGKDVKLSPEVAFAADQLSDDLHCRVGSQVSVVEAQRSPAQEARRVLAVLDAAWAEPTPADAAELSAWVKKQGLVRAPADVDEAARRLGVPAELLREALRGKPGELLPEEVRKALAERRHLDGAHPAPALFRPLRERYFALRDEPGGRAAAIAELVAGQAQAGQYLSPQMHPRALAVDLGALPGSEKRELVVLVLAAGLRVFDDAGAYQTSKDPEALLAAVKGQPLRFTP